MPPVNKVQQEVEPTQTTRAAKKAQDNQHKNMDPVELRMEQRFHKLESAMEAMAASVSLLTKKKSKKRKAQSQAESNPPVPKKQKIEEEKQGKA